MSTERHTIFRPVIALLLAACSFPVLAGDDARARARDLGVAPGIFATDRPTLAES